MSDRYDAGLLNDFGGGNVEWWQDYIRAELDRAHDFYSAALDDAEASIVQWRADERETGEAYMRLRNIIGREAFRTTHGVSHFDVTEAALKAALAACNVTATITFDKTDIAEMMGAAEAEKARAVEAERERCAVIADNAMSGMINGPTDEALYDLSESIAAAIRTEAKP